MNTTTNTTVHLPQPTVGMATSDESTSSEKSLIGLTGLIWGLVVLGGITIIWSRIIPYLNRRRRRVAITSSEEEKDADQRRWLYPSLRFTPLLKKYLLYAPLWRRRRAQSWRGWGGLPTRLQTLFMTSYILLNLGYIVLGDWRSKKDVLEELRKRSGTIAAANMVPLVVLAARNNVLIRLLGISFDTCNLVHRWIGRTVLLESVVHVAVYVYPKVAEKGWKSLGYKIAGSPFITTGLLGFITLLLILIQSLKPIRSAAYEVFKRIHIFLGVVFTAMIIAHCTLPSTVRYPQRAFIVGALGVLLVERCTRQFWLHYRNHRGGKSTSAIVEAMPGQPDVCRVTMYLPRELDVRPGMHGYLSFKNVRPLESHPFSIAWWAHHEDITMINFIIAAKSGFTKDLYEHALSRPEKCFQTKAKLEGPYGGHRSLASYGHVVLFAGGTGITHQLPFIQHFLQTYNTNTSATRRLVMVWSVRSNSCVEWIRPWLNEINDLRRQLPNDALTLRLFITGKTCSKTKPWLKFMGDGIGMEVERGRPIAKMILHGEVLEQIGAMCVGVCGPGGLADDAREAVRWAQGTGQDVDFWEESFGW